MADLQGTRSIQVAAPPEHCFAIAADLDRVTEWHRAMTRVEVLERDRDGRAMVVESEIDATVARVRMRLRFDYNEHTGLRWSRDSGDLRSLEGSWHFQEQGDGLTLATLRWRSASVTALPPSCGHSAGRYATGSKHCAPTARSKGSRRAQRRPGRTRPLPSVERRGAHAFGRYP